MSAHQLASYMRQARSNPLNPNRRRLKAPAIQGPGDLTKIKKVIDGRTYFITPNRLFVVLMEDLTRPGINQGFVDGIMKTRSAFGITEKRKFSTSEAQNIIEGIFGEIADTKVFAPYYEKEVAEQVARQSGGSSSRPSSSRRSASTGSSSTPAKKKTKKKKKPASKAKAETKPKAKAKPSVSKQPQKGSVTTQPAQPSPSEGGIVATQPAQNVGQQVTAGALSNLSTPALVGIGAGAVALVGGILYIALAD